VHCGKGVIRQYSLCGFPDDRRHFQIAVRQVDRSRGGSDLMHMAVKEGDWLEIGSPRSNFPLDEGSPYSILIAGGIGITPIIAMADRLHALGRSFVLHYFTHAANHTVFRDRLARGEYADKVATTKPSPQEVRSNS
jgi:vanillate O-demethylase ferredoxin subunit